MPSLLLCLSLLLLLLLALALLLSSRSLPERQPLLPTVADPTDALLPTVLNLLNRQTLLQRELDEQRRLTFRTAAELQAAIASLRQQLPNIVPLPASPAPSSLHLPPTADLEAQVAALDSRLSALEWINTQPPQPHTWHGQEAPPHTTAAVVLDLPETFFSPKLPEPPSPQASIDSLELITAPEPPQLVHDPIPEPLDPTLQPRAYDWDGATTFSNFGALLRAAIANSFPSAEAASTLCRSRHYSISMIPGRDRNDKRFCHTIKWHVNRDCYIFQQTNRHSASTFCEIFKKVVNSSF